MGLGFQGGFEVERASDLREGFRVERLGWCTIHP